MGRVVMWQRVDTVGLEYAEIEWAPLRIQGEVIVMEAGTPCAISYRIECDDGRATARAWVRLRCEGKQTELTHNELSERLALRP
jgi:hypothetical protein